jgi:septum formation protein
MRIILASASPRRAELLRAAGIDYDVIVANVDEGVRPGEAAHAYVRRLAEEKARAVEARAAGSPVLGADTVVVLGDSILAKPADPAEAARMLKALSGRSHEVLTGIALLHGGACVSRVAATRVEFATLTDADIARYVASGEPLDKAGAYAIQGLASRFVTRIDGSYSNVVGLPVALVWELLARPANRVPGE